MIHPEMLHRDSCVFDNSDLEALFTFKDVPIFMGCVDSNSSDDIKRDMVWKISPITGVIQLTELVPLDILYMNSHTPGTVGSLWNQHHQDFSKFISRFTPGSVFEIGGSHGILSKKYKEHYSCIPWTIIEPSPQPQLGVTAKFITGFFNSNTAIDFHFDTVVHSHVLEHTYYPVEFLRLIHSKLNVNQHMIFSIPNMKSMLEKKYANCLNFEHTFFLDEGILDHTLHMIGFNILEKNYFKDDHSIFYCCSKSSRISSDQLRLINNEAYTYNKKLFSDFTDYYTKLVNSINLTGPSSSKIYLFGAHIFSQVLIQFGLDTSMISGILDNDKNKQGRRLYGTNLRVYSPSVLQSLDSPIVIVKAGTYTNEIIDDIVNNINPTAVFL